MRNAFRCGDISTSLTAADLNGWHCAASLAKIKGNIKYRLNISRCNVLNSSRERGYGGNGVSLINGLIVRGIKCAEARSKRYNIGDRHLCIGKVVKPKRGVQMCTADIEHAAIVEDLSPKSYAANGELGAGLQLKASNSVAICVDIIHLLIAKEGDISTIAEDNCTIVNIKIIFAQVNTGFAADGNVTFQKFNLIIGKQLCIERFACVDGSHKVEEVTRICHCIGCIAPNKRRVLCFNGNGNVILGHYKAVNTCFGIGLECLAVQSYRNQLVMIKQNKCKAYGSAPNQHLVAVGEAAVFSIYAVANIPVQLILGLVDNVKTVFKSTINSVAVFIVKAVARRERDIWLCA